MDWQFNLLLLLVLIPLVYSWSPIASVHKTRRFYESEKQEQQSQSQQQQQTQRQYQPQRNAVSPYLDLILCPIREEPRACARQQSARLLDIWEDDMNVQWQKLKDEADRQLNTTLERRGYSESTTLIKEKPSTILKKIEIGTNFMKKYLAETMDGFLGREYDYLQNSKNNFQTQNEEVNQDDAEESEEAEDDDDEGESEEEEHHEHVNEQMGGLKTTNNVEENSNNVAHDNNDSEVEFIELEEENNEENDEETNDAIDELRRPGGVNKRRKRKKKGNQHDVASQAANILVIQPLEQQLTTQHHDDQFEAHGATQLLKPLGHKIKPSKQKRRKRKKGGHDGGTSTIFIEQEPSTDHFGLGLLEELVELDGDVGGKRKKKYPMKYGRSNGATRFKKKKKKKALMKLMLLGSFLKSKIELLVKLVGVHLQIKFFAIALIGLLINIARFWIDVKRGGVPQKVVYVEHANHQHHYEDHGEDWSEPAGGYWKRSLQTDSTENTNDSVTDSYQPSQLHKLQSQQEYDSQYLAYRNQWQRK